MDQQSKKWYVVRAISGKEKKAKEYIENEMSKRGWSDLVPQVLIPTEKVYSIRNGKKVVKDRNYFPGYVLLEAELKDEIIPVIQNVPNVLDFLREKDGAPIPMRPAEVNRILGNMDDQLDSDGGMVDKFKDNTKLEPWEKVSAAVGVAYYNEGTDKTAEEVFKRADADMYQNKLAMKATRKD